MTLSQYLAEAAATPFDWATRNCILWPAEWVRLRTGVDPAADLRGRARTRFGWARIIRAEGGIEDLVGRRMAAAGLGAVEQPGLGDVGLIRALTAEGIVIVGGIFTGKRWAALGRAEDGATRLFCGEAAHVAAWRL